MSSSSIDPSLPPLKPHYAPQQDPSAARKESAQLAKLISTLKLQEHIEGGYFVELDRDPYRVPNPFLADTENQQSQQEEQQQGSATNANGTGSNSQETTFYTTTGAVSADLSHTLTAADKEARARETANNTSTSTTAPSNDDKTRNASTSIHYLLTPGSPLGAFHRNKGRTIHTLHRGRGRYVLIHADEVMETYDSHEGLRGKARVEAFVVGQDVEKGERLQWVVEGGKYKASFLLEDQEGKGEGGESGGLLISETVVPGFEYSDHDFMRVERLEALVTKEQVSYKASTHGDLHMLRC